jgi:hypothetical protein
MRAGVDIGFSAVENNSKLPESKLHIDDPESFFFAVLERLNM